MTLQELLWEGTGRLEAAGVGEAAGDARTLLLLAFELSLARFLAEKDRPLAADAAEKQERYERLIGERARRVPLQQLTGSQGFMGFDFVVNSHVLSPRQDTETLVELVLQEQKGRAESLLDVCTGSGCIALSLALLGGFQRVTALDVSPEALAVAKENAARLLGEDWNTGGRAERGRYFCLLQSDLFAALEPGERYDVIVSNPPYIPSRVIEELEPEVRDFEPRIALDGDADGLKFYRILARECASHLRPGGAVYMEIGFDQGESVSALFAGEGWREIRVVPDLAGRDRVVRALRP